MGTGPAGRASPPHPLDGEWYIHVDGQTFGPFSGHELRGFVAEGRVTRRTDVARVGSDSWTSAEDDRDLVRLFSPSARPAQPPPEPGPVNAAPGATVVQVTNTITREASRPIVLDLGDARPKSAGTALILSILICGLGQLYNGQVGKGIGMFVLCVALWFVFLGWIINIWSWIDAYQTAKRMNDRYLRLLASGAAV